MPLARQLFDAHGVSKHVAASTVDGLLDSAGLRTYSRGQFISRLGDAVSHLHVFLTGTVEVCVEGANGERAVSWYMGPGHWLGLISLLDGKPSPHHYIAHAATTALAIPGRAFHEAMAADPKLVTLCLRILCKRARGLFAHQTAEILLPLRGRIARMLLMMRAQWVEASPDGREIGLKISQDDFAAMLGVTRQSLNRELRSLEAEGKLALRYSRIQLLDVPALEGIVGDSFSLPVASDVPRSSMPLSL